MDAIQFKQLLKQANSLNLTKVNNLKGILTLILELILSIAIVCGLCLTTPWTLPFIALQLTAGIIIFRWFVILHECGHKTLYTSLLANSIVGHIASIFCLIPYFSWRNIHLLHHRWVGIIDKDPTQKDLLKLHHSSNVQNALFRIVWRLWIPIPFAQFLYKVFWGYAFTSFKNKEYKNFRLGLFSNFICLLSHLGLIIFLGIGIWATYFLPMLVAFYFMIENMNLPQHSELFPYLSSTRAEPIPFAQQAEITRSTHLPDLLGCALALNFNRHTEHHLFPATPWYNLNKMRKMLMDSGYQIPHEVEFMEFMYKLRSRDPLKIYRDSLPKPMPLNIVEIQD